MNLNQKGQRLLDMTIKSIAFCAVLGAVVLLVAVHYVEKMFNDTISASVNASPPPAKGTK